MPDLPTPAELHQRAAERWLAQLREQVTHELFALRALLQALMRPAPPGIRAIARVGGDGFY